MEGRRIRMKAAAATTLALTGGYLLTERIMSKLLEGAVSSSFGNGARFLVRRVHRFHAVA